MPDDVRIVDYDPGWPDRAAEEIERVAAALGEKRRAAALHPTDIFGYLAARDAFVRWLEAQALAS